MPAPLEEGSDGDTIELRVYIKVSKRGHPELASLLAGLNKREQSRLVSALVFRGAIVSAQPASVATMPACQYSSERRLEQGSVH